MRDPLITCIVPVYNGERYLGEALDSILAQTYRSLEIIVVDDGSTDRTPGVAARYGDRVRYVRQENGGPAAARNRGIDEARGNFLAFLDADDLWHNRKLALQTERFRARPGLGICLAHFKNFWAPELREEAKKFRSHPLAQPTPGYFSSSLIARRAVFDAVGRFDERLFIGENTDWFLRARDRQIVMELLPDVLIFRRLHRDNTTRCHPSSSRDFFLGFVKTSLDRKRSHRPSGVAEPSDSEPVQGT